MRNLVTFAGIFFQCWAVSAGAQASKTTLDCAVPSLNQLRTITRLRIALQHGDPSTASKSSDCVIHSVSIGRSSNSHKVVAAQQLSLTRRSDARNCMSGANVAEAWHLVGTYAGRILKGEKPGDLPVQQSVKVEFVVNLKSAKALGLTIPTAVLALANEVIE
jgi:ABC transporter substrate binding protein